MWGNVSGGEVDVVVQVGEVPFESGGVGQYAYGVFVEVGNTVYDFEDNLASGGFAYAPVDGGGGTGGLVAADDADGGKCGFDFIYG